MFVARDKEKQQRGMKDMARRKMRKEQQTQKLLATVVMGMNLVNTVAPMAALAVAEQQTQLPQPAASEAQPLDYAILPQALDYLDWAIFATAEATEYDGNASVGSMGSGDTQTITSGQNGTVGTMIEEVGRPLLGGIQTISSGGAGTVSTMLGGTQMILSGGVGTVSTMLGGTQIMIAEDNKDNKGTVSTMLGGVQRIDHDTKGTVITMSGGTQNVRMGGIGTVSTMNSGTQNIEEDGIGTVSTMLDGSQCISVGGIGIIIAMSGGTQNISSGGTGTVSMLSGGTQNISSGCVGSVNTINDGLQYIISGGTGTVSELSGGRQVIVSGASGTISTMNDGRQGVAVNGSGMIYIMNGGCQDINATGSVFTMNGGTQRIAGGKGAVNMMNGGTQIISYGGIGSVVTMNGGEQIINNYGSSAVVVNMSGGVQRVGRGVAGLVSTMKGGTQYISSGGTGTVSELSGGTQYIVSGGTSLDTVLNSGGTVYQNSGGIISGITYSGGVQIIDNIITGYDDMTLGSGGTNVTMGVISGAQMSSTMINSGGMQQVLAGGTALATEVNSGSMYLASGGVVDGLTMSGGALLLESLDGADFSVGGTLTANSAIINMTAGGVTKASVPAYETLTIEDLKGSGNTFIMDTDLAGEANSDKVTITSAEAGTHYVQIRDLSKLNNIEVTGAHQQLLITDDSGQLIFEGKELNYGGLWDVDPTLTQGDKLGLSGNDWYLTKLAKTVNNDTQVLLDAAENSYALWRNTNDSLRSRLGALGNGSERADGIWARTQAGRFSGDGYEGRYNLYQLGFDQKADAKSTYGLAVDYGDGSGSYDPGSGKDKLTAFSLYGVWQGAKGTYTNVTARAGIFDTDLKSYGDFPDKASYKEHAYSISVEYGQRFDLQQGLFFEPQAQFTLGRLGGISYTTDRGANGHIEGMNSAIGRIGFVMGQKIKNGSDIYLKADLMHEFAGERDLQLTSDAGGTNDILNKHNDYGDTWFELGLGANIRLSKASSFYGEVERGFGGEINKKWSVNAGLRFAF